MLPWVSAVLIGMAVAAKTAGWLLCRGPSWPTAVLPIIPPMSDAVLTCVFQLSVPSLL